MELLIDTHVHVHNCFELDQFLDSAWKNFTTHAQSPGQGEIIGILMLTETYGADWFKNTSLDITNGSGTLQAGVWNLSLVGDGLTILAEQAGKELYIVSGRQIVTKERLEVLALGTNADIEDGNPIREVIKLVNESGALAIIPWGFGKWTGKRGKIVTQLLQEFRADQIMLGDNSGRCGLLPYPKHFEDAKTKGIRVLPGSDPLPKASQYKKPGCYGVITESVVDSSQPSSAVKVILKNQNETLKTYGKLENPVNFFVNQIYMQIINRI